MSERETVGLFANNGERLKKLDLPENIKTILNDEQSNYIFFVVPEDGQRIEHAVVVRADNLKEISGPDGFHAAKEILLSNNNSNGVLYQARLGEDENILFSELRDN